MNFTHAQLQNLFELLSLRTQKLPPPASEAIVNAYGRDPFLLLIFCILSLRTRDAVSYAAAQRLFLVAKTAKDIAQMNVDILAKIIYPVGFYKRKAMQIIKCSQIILEKFHSHVPNTENELLSLPGVGRKTMNLVLQEGFFLPALCVDTHVHRIANKLGLVHTKTPEDTEYALKQLLPQTTWRDWNHVLLIYGQYVCPPRKHQCDNDPEKHP